MMRNRDHLDHSRHHAINEAERKAWKDVAARASANARPSVRCFANSGHGVLQLGHESLGRARAPGRILGSCPVGFTRRSGVKTEPDINHPDADAGEL